MPSRPCRLLDHVINQYYPDIWQRWCNSLGATDHDLKNNIGREGKEEMYVVSEHPSCTLLALLLPSY